MNKRGPGSRSIPAVSDLYGGVETGGTWCVCAVGRGPNDIVREDQFPTTDPQETLQRIIDFFRADRTPTAIGVGSFGPVDLDPKSPTWGHVTTTPKPGWQHVAVAPVIRDELGVPVAFDNDVDAAALGEYRWGAGRGAGSVCYLTVGTGIGAGLLIDGRPWHGLVHPEVGHIRIPRDPGDSFAGTCPVHGDCWEGLACGPAMAKRWERLPEELPDDHPAWELEASYLALGILSIVLVASPERVIAGGGVMERPGLPGMVRRRLRQLLAGYLESPSLGDAIGSYLVPPALGDRAGVLGAIALAQEKVGG
ncbi:MAG: fructokinase [Solirubrobacteraceae bacterium]|nr:fructokinase [Solirubrobacteraceae bacterium]